MFLCAAHRRLGSSSSLLLVVQCKIFLCAAHQRVSGRAQHTPVVHAGNWGQLYILDEVHPHDAEPDLWIRRCVWVDARTVYRVRLLCILLLFMLAACPGLTIGCLSLLTAASRYAWCMECCRLSVHKSQLSKGGCTGLFVVAHPTVLLCLVDTTGGLMQACQAKHASEPWLCFMSPHMNDVIETPFFMLNSKYDAWQLVRGRAP